MNSESDYTVNIPAEISGPIPVSTRKDLTKQARDARRRRRRDNRRKTEDRPVDDQSPPDDPPPGEGEQDGETHEVDYLV